MTTQVHDNEFTLSTSARVTEFRAPGARPAVTPVRTRLRLTHRGQVALILLVTLVITVAMSIFVLGATGANASSEAAAVEHTYISVQAGETLWQLAEELDPNADPRDLIAEIVALNDLPSSTVEAGQRIALPLRFS